MLLKTKASAEICYSKEWPLQQDCKFKYKLWEPWPRSVSVLAMRKQSAVPSICAQQIPICLSWAPRSPVAASTVRRVPIEAAAPWRVALKRVYTPQISTSLSGHGIAVSAVLSLCGALSASAAVVRASSLLEIAFLGKFAADLYSAGSICILLDFGFKRRSSWMLISRGKA